MKRLVCWITLLVSLMIISVVGAIGCALATRSMFIKLNVHDFVSILKFGGLGTLLAMVSIGFVLALIFLVLLMKEAFKDD